MYCKSCGYLLADDHNVCTQCGTKKGEGEGFCQQCGAKKVPESDFCTSCGFKFAQNSVSLEKSEPEPAEAGETQVLQPSMLVQPNDPYPQNQPIQQFQPQNQPVQPDNGYPQYQQNSQNPPYPSYPQDQQQYQQYPQNPQDGQYQQQYYAPQRKGFCRNCGAEVMQGVPACTNCGTKYGEGFSFCHHCGANAVPGAAACSSCGKSLKPPYTFGRYIKEYGLNFLFGKNSRDVLSVITRVIPTVMAIAAFIIMLCPVAAYSLIPGSSSYYTAGALSSYSAYYSSSSDSAATAAAYSTASMNAFGLSVFGGILFILAFAAALVLKEPFTNSFFEKKPVLAKLSVLIVPLLDTIALGCLALGFSGKVSASDNSYIFIATYPELHIGVGGWILTGVIAVSLIAGIISAITTKTGVSAGSSNPPSIPAPSVNVPPVGASPVGSVPPVTSVDSPVPTPTNPDSSLLMN